MAEANQGADFQQTMTKTDFGQLIYENRKILISVFVAILVGITGYLLWKQNQQSKALNRAENVFEFQTKTWAQAKEGKLSSQELVTKFKQLDDATKNAPSMMPVVLEMGETLYNKGELTEADAILSEVNPTAEMGEFFIHTQRAVVLEKMGKVDEAIRVLEALDSRKDVLMPQKVGLELGRLYMQKGEKGKAQTYLEAVIKKNENDEYARIARLYLSQLGQ